MGQQSIYTYDREEWLERSSKENKINAKKNYIHSHFKIGEKVDEYRWKHYNLIKEVICTDNCEVIDFIFKKLNGLLEGEELKKTLDINTFKSEHDISNIDNYIIEESTWSK